jgi:hypothetical protein
MGYITAVFILLLHFVGMLYVLYCEDSPKWDRMRIIIIGLFMYVSVLVLLFS